MVKAYSLLTVVLLTVLAMPAHAQTWAKYQSQNFTVYTDRRESQVRALIEELEVFRVIAMLQLGLSPMQSENQKLAIVIFGSSREFRRFRHTRNVAGFYTNTNDGPRMVMGSGQQDMLTAKEILFHEYIHHLTFEHSPNFTYPRWYIEGLAELLGSTKVERNSVVVGGRPLLANALDHYGVLRLADVLQNRRQGERSEIFESRFYGTAWLLTHYVQIHALANDPELGRKNRAYLTRYSQGEDSVRAFEEVFETSLDEFDRLLASYSKQRRISILTWPRPELDISLTKSPLDETERNYILADLLSATGQEALALDYLEGISSTEEYFGEALSLQALILNHDEGNAASAEQIAYQAAEVAPDSSVVFGNLAHYEMDSYNRLLSNGQHAAAREKLDLAEAHARRGIELNPEEFNALWYLASVMLVKGRPDEALAVLDQAWAVFPSNLGVRSEIAKILIRRGDMEGARLLVRTLIGAAHTPERAETLIQLQEQIENGNVDPSLLEQI